MTEGQLALFIEELVVLTHVVLRAVYQPIADREPLHETLRKIELNVLFELDEQELAAVEAACRFTEVVRLLNVLPLSARQSFHRVHAKLGRAVAGCNGSGAHRVQALP